MPSLDLKTSLVLNLSQDLAEGPLRAGYAWSCQPASRRGAGPSPDGSRIAFTYVRDGNREVYVMDAAGGAPRNLPVPEA